MRFCTIKSLEIAPTQVMSQTLDGFALVLLISFTKRHIILGVDYMNHLQVYTDLFLANVNHLVPNSDAAFEEMSQILQIKYQVELHPHFVKNAMHQENSPKPSQLIPELLSRGYSPKFVQDLLQTSKQSVSYHKLNPSKREYLNPVFMYHIHDVHMFKKNRHVYMKPVDKLIDVNAHLRILED